ncbi:hypothetical protein CF326_g137 [Tilletia indica]|nr:hypothetical protein CF326_g137 [Tilletia indica]
MATPSHHNPQEQLDPDDGWNVPDEDWNGVVTDDSILSEIRRRGVRHHSLRRPAIPPRIRPDDLQNPAWDAEPRSYPTTADPMAAWRHQVAAVSEIDPVQRPRDFDHHPMWQCHQVELSYHWRVKMFFDWVDSFLDGEDAVPLQRWDTADLLDFCRALVVYGLETLPETDEMMRANLADGEGTFSTACGRHPPHPRQADARLPPTMLPSIRPCARCDDHLSRLSPEIMVSDIGSDAIPSAAPSVMGAGPFLPFPDVSMESGHRASSVEVEQMLPTARRPIEEMAYLGGTGSSDVPAFFDNLNFARRSEYHKKRPKRAGDVPFHRPSK